MMLGRRPLGLVAVGAVARRLTSSLEEMGAADSLAQAGHAAIGAVVEAGAASAAAPAAMAAAAVRPEAVDLDGAALALVVAPVSLLEAAAAVEVSAAGLAGLAPGVESVAIGAFAGDGLWLDEAATEAGSASAEGVGLAGLGALGVECAEADDAAFALALVAAVAIEPGAALDILSSSVAAVEEVTERGDPEAVAAGGFALADGTDETATVSADGEPRAGVVLSWHSEIGAEAGPVAAVLIGAGCGEPCAVRDAAGAGLDAAARMGEGLGPLDRLLGSLALVGARAEAGFARAVQSSGVIWRRTLEFLARLSGPVLLSARIVGPAVLMGRLAGPIILRGRLGGMAIQHPEREVILGDGYLFRFVVDLGPGIPADLVGASVEFGYGSAPDLRENAARPSAAPEIAATTVRGVVYPTVEVPLSAAETAGLKPRTVYYYACRVALPGADPQTIATGTFRTAPAPL